MVEKVRRTPEEDAAEDWATVDSLLSAALDIEGDSRRRWLAELASAHPAVAQRVVALLALVERSDLIEAVVRSTVCEEALVGLMDVGSGSRFGTWTVLEPLGMGGMSEVYLARRELEEGEQLAALKLLTIGMTRTDALSRFKKETAILSQLNDARIARLIDSGRAADGRPWLAMEYVDGEAIDAGCDRRGFSVKERVKLLIEVANAVDHAHRQLIVHRDIKPGNVLLCSRNQDIRLLDFGIAKVLEPTDPERTSSPTRAFTLNYASPEQLAGKPVSIAGDIYQLGALLYLLLTGVRPFRDAEESSAIKLLAMREGVLPPSQAVRSSAADRHPARCGLNAKRLTVMLLGDLDTIALKAMAFDEQRRYLSARDLAEDLRRWLHGDAVLARPDSFYRIGRKLRKHWASAAAAALSVVLIFAYALNVTWQREALRIERDAAQRAQSRAEATRRFLVRVIGTANPLEEGGNKRSIEEALADAAKSVENEFRDQPEVAAETYGELGMVFEGRGDVGRAEQAFRKSLDVYAGLPDAPPNTSSIIGLAVALSDLGRSEEAQQLLDREFDKALRHYGDQSDEHVSLLYTRARVESALAAPDTAPARARREAEIRKLLQRALAIHDALHRPEDAATQPSDAAGMRSDIEGAIGISYFYSGQALAALPYFDAHYQQQTALHGASAARTLSARMNLANTLQKLERYAESEELLTTMVDELRAQYGRGSHRMVAYALGSLGNQAKLTGDYASAARYWADAEQEAQGALGAEHPWLGSAQFRRAEALALAGDRVAALALLEKVVALEGRSDTLVERTRALLDKLKSGQAPN